MTGWTIGEIPTASPAGRHPVAGWVKGSFGLDFRAAWYQQEAHPDGTAGWVITHIPTGFALFGVLMSLPAAQAIVDEIAALCDWTGITLDNSRFMKGRMQPIIERLGPAKIHVNDMIPPWAEVEFFTDDGARPQLRLVERAPKGSE